MPKKGRKVRSMRGVEVDFDLMEIKAQIASAPKTIEVKAREDFVDRRMRRRMKRLERRKEAEKELEAKNAGLVQPSEPKQEKPSPKVASNTLSKEEAEKVVEESLKNKKPIVTQTVSVSEPKNTENGKKVSTKARQIKKKKTKEE